ncbi:hypothetical protein D3C86_1026580 [compost metagenome]
MSRLGPAPVLGLLEEVLEVGHDQGGDEVAAVADHHGLGDEGAQGEGPLDGLRRDVLAVRHHQDLLLAIGDGQVAVVAQGAHVAGAQPAVGGDGLAGGLFVVEVAEHDVGAAGQDLAVLGDLDLDVGEGLAHRADPGAAGPVHGDDRRGLGEAIALEHRDAEDLEEHAHLARQSGAARDAAAQAAAGALAHLREDELVGELELHGGPGTGLLPLLPGHEDAAAEVQGPGEQGALDQRALVDRAEHPGADLLVDARHADDEGRLDLDQVGGDGVHGLGVSGAGALGEEGVVGDALEDVAQGQEAQGAVLGLEVDQVQHAARVGRVVAVAEHDPLGVARGARGVDDRGDALGLDGALPVGDLVVVLGAERLALGDEVGELDDLETGALAGFRVHDHHQAQRVGFLGGFEDLVALLDRRADHDLGAGVVEDVGQLLGREGHVDRDVDGPDALDGHVRLDPLGAVLAQEGDAIARTHAGLDQGRSERRDAAIHLAEGDVVPRPVLLVPEAHPFPVALHGVVVDGDEGFQHRYLLHVQRCTL